MSRTCKKCGFVFDGIRCMPCKHAAAKQYHIAHRDMLRAKSAQYHAAHKTIEQEKNRNYYEANKEAVKARATQWRKDNPERVKLIARKATVKWRAKNPEQVRAAIESWRRKNQSYFSDWYLRNKERVQRQTTEWRAKNPGRRKIQWHNRRVKERANGGILSPNIVSLLFDKQRGLCACCNAPLGDDFHLDHIVPICLGGPNTDANVQLLIAKCNLQKGRKHPDDFLKLRRAHDSKIDI